VSRKTVVLMLLLFCALAVAGMRAEDAQQTFPLAEGTYWVYHGLVRSQEKDLTYGKVTDVTWKMSVVRLVQRDGLTATVVTGFPADLNWSDGHAEPQLSRRINWLTSIRCRSCSKKVNGFCGCR